jgi:hypothetical protein
VRIRLGIFARSETFLQGGKELRKRCYLESRSVD